MTTFNEYRVSNVLNKDGTVNYYGKILSCEEANQYFDLLNAKYSVVKRWSYHFGKHITTKRKVAWYDDSVYSYTYSNITKQALAWTKELSEANSGRTCRNKIQFLLAELISQWKWRYGMA